MAPGRSSRLSMYSFAAAPFSVPGILALALVPGVVADAVVYGCPKLDDIFGTYIGVSADI